MGRIHDKAQSEREYRNVYFLVGKAKMGFVVILKHLIEPAESQLLHISLISKDLVALKG